ncbi:MAG: ferritin family protein [Deltaproteobacteria bacterium]|nr:ferritin family protein [Deltaproteobacteria bacterium]
MTNLSNTQVAEALKAALRVETDGRYFYLMAAGSTVDPKGKEIFERLAREEQSHFEFLEQQYRAIAKTGRLDASLKLGAPSDLTGPSPIFSNAIRSRLAEAHFEMTALSVGVELELSSERHYSVAAAAATDPVARAFFRELAQWEAGHYRALTAQQDDLKEDYWAAGGFAPF